jgi:hypothetical protein
LPAEQEVHWWLSSCCQDSNSLASTRGLIRICSAQPLTADMEKNWDGPKVCAVILMIWDGGIDDKRVGLMLEIFDDRGHDGFPLRGNFK